MTLGSAQRLTEMRTGDLPWEGKGGLCLGLGTLLSSCADCLKLLGPQPPGALGACLGVYTDCFTFTCKIGHVVCSSL